MIDSFNFIFATFKYVYYCIFDQNFENGNAIQTT